jgi:hypothetical protein
MKPLKVVLLKPSKYNPDGHVQRFWRGFLPNATGNYIKSMTPRMWDGRVIETEYVDETVYHPSEYMHLLKGESGCNTLVALVGVQSHQFQRSLDLAAYAFDHGCMAIVGGPHPMTCDTTMLQGHGVSFALAEAEMIWPAILSDAMEGELRHVYGGSQRWTRELDSPVLEPPTQDALSRYLVPMMGVYPARGCPFLCNFCSVIRIAGRRVRSQPIETTIQTLRAAKAAGVKLIIFTSDNLNKYAEVKELMQAMIEEKLGLNFFCQCDTQVARQGELIELMRRAGCFQIFVGVESFDRDTLKGAHKGQNRPETYHEIVRLCRESGTTSHFSNIIGFPSQTRGEVLEHLDILRGMAPNTASFYILTSIPGTEQYADFLAQGLITEKNLDRYDTTHLLFRHPNFSGRELSALLFRCYREFYDLGDTFRKARASYRNNPHPAKEVFGSAASCVFHWASGALGRHPMSGGIGIRNIDRVQDYRSFRRKYFGDVLEEGDLVPLPGNLELSEADAALNRKVNLTQLAASV